ncbi:adenosine deaminase [Ornithinimicrobium tianjinense]|uniref:Adenosine deaminase n=1 Tax=Ornithinimicrobium tianjinense TaxID=1195761 RepID=A0A917BPQ8_9MICO|nr:adenosine deaminase [Ornithinimicrobium tianjinense]GGF51414.1 adenosine deaminase 1 [Ornithinimicrobium tianjinense]
MTTLDTRELPKVVLHDHLDGGLRPATVLELAQEQGYAALPASDVGTLAAWFADAADSGSLVRYLETFDHTVGVMQTEDALARVARECVVDLAEDGVVYAEVRYAPEQHLQRGLTLDQVVEAANRGFREGEEEAASAGRRIRVRVLPSAMRHAARAVEIAQLTVRHLGDQVAGFDIAGAEDGHPPTRHLAAFDYLRQHNAHFTIHAGEAFGLPSIWEAIQFCGAERLGHGVRIVDDIRLDGRPVTDDLAGAIRWAAVEPNAFELGPLAAYVKDRRIPLEMCPSSNVQTGAAESIETHPISLLKDLNFRVTLNTDNRLMSATSMSREAQLLVDRADWQLSDLRRVAVNAMKSAFLPFDERLEIIEGVLKPAYDVG